MVSVIVENAEWMLFIWILANQGGLPVPAAPVLLGVGGLVESGRLDIVTTMAVVIGATLCADLVWYTLGRRWGARILAVIGRFSPTARRNVQRGQYLFLDHAGPFRLGARFLPELSPIAAGLPGRLAKAPRTFLSTG